MDKKDAIDRELKAASEAYHSLPEWFLRLDKLRRKVNIERSEDKLQNLKSDLR